MATNAKNLAELLNGDVTVTATDIADGSVTSAKLDTDISVTGDFKADSSNSTLFVDASTNKVHVGGGTSDANTSALSVRKGGGSNFVANFENTSTASPYGVMVRDPSGSSTGYPLLQVSNSGGNHYFRVDSNTGNNYFAPGGTEVARTTSEGVIINESGSSTTDFRVESDSNSNALFVDASDNSVTLGNNKNILNNMAFWTEVGSITTSSSNSTRFRITLANYNSCYVRIIGQRTNGGNALSYWEGVINMNNNANFVNMWNERNSNPSYTFDYTTVGIFQWTFPGSPSSATLTTFVQQVRGTPNVQLFVI